MGSASRHQSASPRIERNCLQNEINSEKEKAASLSLHTVQRGQRSGSEVSPQIKILHLNELQFSRQFKKPSAAAADPSLQGSARKSIPTYG